MSRTPAEQVEYNRRVDELRRKRGKQDGESGLSPTDASEAYLAGYMDGRRALASQHAVTPTRWEPSAVDPYRCANCGRPPHVHGSPWCPRSDEGRDRDESFWWDNGYGD